MKRFGKPTEICTKIKCNLKKRCINFLAMLEWRDELDGTEKRIRTCEKTLIELPTENLSTDCLFCSKDGLCFKRHVFVCDMECANCPDFYKRTYDLKP